MPSLEMYTLVSLTSSFHFPAQVVIRMIKTSHDKERKCKKTNVDTPLKGTKDSNKLHAIKELFFEI